jgi:hypothetical protein
MYEINQQHIYIKVDNTKNDTYSLWVSYNYTCDDKKGQSQKRLFHTDDSVKEVIINIPKENLICDQTFGIQLINVNGDIIFRSHKITLIGEYK